MAAAAGQPIVGAGGPVPAAAANTAGSSFTGSGGVSGVVPIVSAESGQAAAVAGVDTSILPNTQVSVGQTGGGNGSLAVINGNSVVTERLGSAIALSGMAAAFTPEPGTTGLARSQTLASSGNVGAAGVEAVNIVSNNSLALVQVAGQNSGAVAIQSLNSVSIGELGGAAAVSGSALAVPVPAPGPTLGPVASAARNGGTAVPAASAPTSVTGLQIENKVALNATPGVATAQAGSTAGVTVNQALGANIVNVGNAVARSGAACVGAGCAPAAATVAPLASGLSAASAGTAVPATGTQAGGAQAASGSADALGVRAVNSVNTNANVLVSVGGENHGIINVVIEAVTQIINYGIGLAASGSSYAGNGSTGQTAAANSGGTGASAPAGAQSGNVQATGGQVSNDVNISASQTVNVAGDNHNPINVLITLVANLTNWGFGWASSGNSQATGGSAGSGQGAASATSGGAQAIGMDVQNQVNMSALANVQIQGSNYADITVHVRFITRIDNEGEAIASSGDVQAMGAPSSAGSTNTSVTQQAVAAQQSGASQQVGSGQSSSVQASAGSGFSSVEARSGDVVARGNASAFSLSNLQVASGNSGTPASSTSAHIVALPTLPALDPVVSQGEVRARSGNAIATGWDSTTLAMNTQVSACANPSSSVQCLAANVAEYSDQTHGDVVASSGFAGINATPTAVPTTTTTTKRPVTRASSSGGSKHRTTYYWWQYTGAQTGPGWYWVWVPYPKKATPKATTQPKPFSDKVNVRVPSQWPDLDLPPMPDQADAPAVLPQVLSGAPSSSGGPALPTVRGQVNVNLWAVQPAPQTPPMPPNQSLNGAPGAVPTAEKDPNAALLRLLVALVSLLVLTGAFAWLATRKRAKVLVGALGRQGMAFGRQSMATLRMFITMLSAFVLVILVILGLGGDR
jgi:hypothetical protein